MLIIAGIMLINAAITPMSEKYKKCGELLPTILMAMNPTTKGGRKRKVKT